MSRPSVQDAEREIAMIERLFADTERRIDRMAREGRLAEFIARVGPRWQTKHREGVFGRRLEQARLALDRAARSER